jgi:hypothetical protein
MPISLAPIQPSAPPPVYCAECGCEVDPAAWLCATCGKPLHEPGAMTSTRLDAPATTKNTKRKAMVGAQIFSILIFLLFFGLRMDWIPAEIPGHPLGPKLLFLGVFVVFLWIVLSDYD